MSDSQEAKGGRSVATIDGVEVIDPETLRGTDFSRFRNDELYFIDFVWFYPHLPKPNESDKDVKPLQRVLALTPFALFVTDLDGAMDRATRYEDLSEMFTQRKVNKKLFGSESLFHMVLKVPREVDWHIAFDVTKSDAKAKKFTDVLSAIWVFKTGDLQIEGDGEEGKRKKKKFRLTEVESSIDIKTKIGTEVAADYVPPEEIKRRNREQQLMLERIDQVSAEVVTLQKQVEEVRSSCKERQGELKQMEAKYGVELTQLRTQKQSLQQKQVGMHKQITNGEIELVKLQADVARLREQLDEERANYNSIVQKRVTSAGDSVSQRQHEVMSLRQKAQQKELAKALAKSQALKETLSVKPTYDGPLPLVQKAEMLEQRIDEAVALWTQEMESSNKIEKFLDAINAEISRVSNQIAEKNDEKQALLEKRESIQQGHREARAASASVSFDDDDMDVIVPNQSVTALPPSTRTLPDDDDDHFGLSERGALPHSVANAGRHSDPLDDLLDDGASVPATTAAPIPDDLF